MKHKIHGLNKKNIDAEILIPWYMVSLHKEDDHVIEDSEKGKCAEGRHLLEPEKAHTTVCDCSTKFWPYTALFGL